MKSRTNVYFEQYERWSALHAQLGDQSGGVRGSPLLALSVGQNVGRWYSTSTDINHSDSFS